MCGLCGAMGDYDPQVVKTLLILNQERGSDAVGLYNNDGEFVKKAIAARKYLTHKDPHDFIKMSKPGGAIYGHTRAGTRGGNIDDNAHPFKYGEVIGAHNGVITNAPSGKDGYAVDSMFAFDELSKVEPGKYQDALGKMSGWYMLVWRDLREKATYFLSWNGDLSFAFMDNAWYYSSSDSHLHTATGVEPSMKFQTGDVVRWDGKSLKRIAKKFTGHIHTHNNSQSDVLSTRTGRDRWDDSFTGEVMRVGPMGVWVGRRKNDVWEAMACQDDLSGLWPKAPLGDIFRVADPRCLTARAEAKEKDETKGAQLTEVEMDRKRDEIIRDCEWRGATQYETEKELEKAGLA